MLRIHVMAEEAFNRYLPDLQGWVGWFVLVQGDRLGGVFPTYEAAALAWMSLYGPVPALIRRIEAMSGGKTAVIPPTPGVAAVLPTPPALPAPPGPKIDDVLRLPNPFRWAIPWAANAGVPAPKPKHYVA